MADLATVYVDMRMHDDHERVFQQLPTDKRSWLKFEQMNRLVAKNELDAAEQLAGALESAIVRREAYKHLAIVAVLSGDEERVTRLAKLPQVDHSAIEQDIAFARTVAGRVDVPNGLQRLGLAGHQLDLALVRAAEMMAAKGWPEAHDAVLAIEEELLRAEALLALTRRERRRDARQKLFDEVAREVERMTDPQRKALVMLHIAGEQLLTWDDLGEARVWLDRAVKTLRPDRLIIDLHKPIDGVPNRWINDLLGKVQIGVLFKQGDLASAKRIAGEDDFRITLICIWLAADGRTTDAESYVKQLNDPVARASGLIQIAALAEPRPVEAKNNNRARAKRGRK